jgi:CDGSH-type Zn-finger protein
MGIVVWVERVLIVTKANQIKVRTDGPLLCTGKIEIYSADGDLILKTDDVVLCRCGHSSDKPFCDGSHKKSGFKHDSCFTDEKTEALDKSKPLKITVRTNAMLIVSGPVHIMSADGACQTTRNKVALCRCGESSKKPFCDAAHKRCGFLD